jgi:nitrous oxidase accessory protein NosD
MKGTGHKRYAATWTQYAFDGRFYRDTQCFDLDGDGVSSSAREVPCRRRPSRD